MFAPLTFSFNLGLHPFDPLGPRKGAGRLNREVPFQTIRSQVFNAGLA